MHSEITMYSQTYIYVDCVPEFYTYTCYLLGWKSTRSTLLFAIGITLLVAYYYTVTCCIISYYRRCPELIMMYNYVLCYFLLLKYLELVTLYIHMQVTCCVGKIICMYKMLTDYQYKHELNASTLYVSLDNQLFLIASCFTLNLDNVCNNLVYMPNVFSPLHQF